MLTFRNPVPSGDGGLLLLAASRRTLETKIAHHNRSDEGEHSFLASAMAEISRSMMERKAASLEGAKVQLEAAIEWNGCDGYTMDAIRSVLSVIERELSRQGRA